MRENTPPSGSRVDQRKVGTGEAPGLILGLEQVKWALLLLLVQAGTGRGAGDRSAAAHSSY